MRLTIQRSRWLRGHPYSYLLNDEGDMCCLGFLCKDKGIRDKDILNMPGPWMLLALRPQLSDILSGLAFRDDDVRMNTTFSEDAIEINDDIDLSEENRESQLIDLFKEKGIELVFED